MIDLMPTFLDVASARYPTTWEGRTLVPMEGRSLMPLLRGEDTETYLDRELGMEAYGMDAFRRGDWKVLRLPAPYGNGTWQLYDLAADPGETEDLAATNPNLVAELAQAWDDYAEASGVIRPDKPIAYAKPVSAGRF